MATTKNTTPLGHMLSLLDIESIENRELLHRIRQKRVRTPQVLSYCCGMLGPIAFIGKSKAKRLILS